MVRSDETKQAVSAHSSAHDHRSQGTTRALYMYKAIPGNCLNVAKQVKHRGPGKTAGPLVVTHYVDDDVSGSAECTDGHIVGAAVASRQSSIVGDRVPCRKKVDEACARWRSIEPPYLKAANSRMAG